MSTRLPTVARLGGTAYVVVCAAYLLLPVVVMVAFSFNQPAGRFNFVWNRFSLDAWREPLAVPGLAKAVAASLRVTIASTAIATTLGTLAAYGLARGRPGRPGASGLLLALPLAAPDVVMGASLLTFLVVAGIPSGGPALVAAHVMFTLSYVTFTVRARVRGADWTLEDAAADLGAGPFRIFRTVTLPLLWPGILAGAALAFSLSLDDFTVSLFVAGSVVTFPLYVWGAARVAVPPQVNVVACLMLLLPAAAVAVASWQRRITSRRRAA